ncbi:MAG: hypothetical protein AAGC74_12710 [Verrucomicrobiota bacterium]
MKCLNSGVAYTEGSHTLVVGLGDGEEFDEEGFAGGDGLSLVVFSWQFVCGE